MHLVSTMSNHDLTETSLLPYYGITLKQVRYTAALV